MVSFWAKSLGGERAVSIDLRGTSATDASTESFTIHEESWRRFNATLISSQDQYITFPEISFGAESSKVEVTGFEFRQQASPTLSLPMKVHVHEIDPEDTTNYGYACNHDPSDVSDEFADCLTFTCGGDTVQAMHGQFVSVVAVRDVNLTEIRVLGGETRCPFSAVTDSEGSFVVHITDSTGMTPIKTHVDIGAYKVEVFEKTTQPILQTSDVTDPLNVPSKVLLVLKEDDSSSPETTTSLLGRQRWGRRLLGNIAQYLPPPPPPPPSPPPPPPPEKAAVGNVVWVTLSRAKASNGKVWRQSLKLVELFFRSRCGESSVDPRPDGLSARNLGSLWV